MAGVEDASPDDRNCRRDGDQSADSARYDGGVEDTPSSLGVSCSICLELVADDGCRSRAKLQCGHEFHLDCIGSAFNMKGAMQCPNCRKVEKGQWLYANGSPRPLPEFIMEDWIPDEDLYGLSYPEMLYRFHWCPFGELSHAAASSFEELESPTTTYHEYRGHQAVYAERTATSSIAHSYLAYVGPVPATTPRTSDNAEDHPWNSHSGQNENFRRPALGATTPYLGWDHRHRSPAFPLPGGHIIASDPVPAEIDASATARPRSYPHPFLFGFRPNPRTAPTIHRHPGSSTVARERIHATHLFNHPQQPGNLVSPLIPLTRRGLPPPLPPPEQSSGGFFVFPPSPSSNLHEPDTDHFPAWERDWFPHFPVPVSSRDSGWGPLNHRTPSNMWHRHFS